MSKQELFQEATDLLMRAQALLLEARAKHEQRVAKANRYASIFPANVKIKVLKWPKL